ncbi:Fibronectin type III domain-containing protein [Butyrivibrio sp. ob235]|uniref:InlB B-repeat-containing protein n=1 Tax=Butyrivibrio sp. ob235 TaxID=1761780 RepID=UPI0008C34810|nr:fibronectin type III domain-containing protein [Butyrivibrio sp. ob235]SEL98271.1 Fibronectin type III domain-containing protein [Butyrivibrio sp. ob235]
MKSINKRILHYLCISAFVIGMLACVKTTAFAALSINGSAVTEPYSGPGWSYNTTTNTLTLNGFTVTSGTQPAISASDLNKFNIVLVGENNINVSNENGILVTLSGSNCKFSISGTGSLKVNSTDSAIRCNGGSSDIFEIKQCAIEATGTGDSSAGIFSETELLISNSATVVATGGDASSNDAYGIFSDAGKVTIKNSNVTATGGTKGIYGYNVAVDNSVVRASALGATNQECAIQGDHEINISGKSTVVATATSEYSYGVSCNTSYGIQISADVKSVIIEGNTALGGRLQNMTPGVGWFNGVPEVIEIHEDSTSITTSYEKVQFPKIAPTITSAPTAKSLTYTGSEQELVIAGTATNGQMEYAIGTNADEAPTTGSFGAQLPKATKAGSYYVWYRAVGTDIYGATDAECIAVEIKKPEYSITISTDGNGTATASANKGVEGTEVTLTATPNSGYKFGEWQVISGGVTVENNKFLIKTSNVEIKAIFEADSTPEIIQINGTTLSELKGGNKSITVSWKEQTDIDGYELQCTVDTDFNTIAKTVTISDAKTTKTTIKKLSDNKKYYVRIRTFKNVNSTVQYSDWSSVNSVKTALPEVIDKKLPGSSITKLKAGKGSMKITWNKQKNVKGYEIEYSLSKNFKKNTEIETISSQRKKTTTIKNLKSKKTYYVRIRTYKESGKKKLCSKWSTVKSIKIK